MDESDRPAPPPLSGGPVDVAGAREEPPFAWAVLDADGDALSYEDDPEDAEEARDRMRGGVSIVPLYRKVDAAVATALRSHVSATPAAVNPEAVKDDTLDIGAGTWRVDERPVCGCDSGADPCGDEDHDLEVADRVLADGPCGGIVPMDDIRHHEDFARAVVRVVNAAPVLLDEIERLRKERDEWRDATVRERIAADVHSLGCPKARRDAEHRDAVTLTGTPKTDAPERA